MPENFDIAIVKMLKKFQYWAEKACLIENLLEYSLEYSINFLLGLDYMEAGRSSRWAGSFAEIGIRLVLYAKSLFI